MRKVPGENFSFKGTYPIHGDDETLNITPENIIEKMRENTGRK